MIYNPLPMPDSDKRISSVSIPESWLITLPARSVISMRYSASGATMVIVLMAGLGKRVALVCSVIFNYSVDDYIDSEKSVWVTLFNQSFGGPSSIILRTLPAMWPGLNNSVSRVEFFGIGGGLIIFDKTFYRRRLATYVNLGMTTIQLPTGLDNKMSSGIKLF